METTGRVIIPSELNRVADELISNCRDKIDDLLVVESSLHVFQAEHQLGGMSWAGLKNQMSDYHAIIAKFIMAYDYVCIDAQALKGILAGNDEELIEETINDSILFHTNLISNLQTQNVELSLARDSYRGWNPNSGIIRANNSTIRSSETALVDLNDKLERLNAIDRATQSLFASARDIFTSIGSGLESIRGAWNGSDFVGSGTGAWRSRVDTEWGQRRIDVINRGLDFTTLNQDFWDCEDFFVDYWWLDPDRLSIATEVLLYETSILGELDLYELSRAFDVWSNFRLQTLQALLGVPIDGMAFWDGSSSARLENFLRNEGIYVCNRGRNFSLNITIDAETLYTLIDRYANCEVWQMHRLIDANMPYIILGCFAGSTSARAVARMRITPGPRGTGGNGGVLNNARYAQRTFSNTFSPEGIRKYSRLAGRPIKTVNDLSNAIRSGRIKVSDLPVEYIVRDGNVLILNTRTSQALTQAGIPRSQWTVVNRTGQPFFEELLTGQLSRNKLDSTGIETVTPGGGN